MTLFIVATNQGQRAARLSQRLTHRPLGRGSQSLAERHASHIHFKAPKVIISSGAGYKYMVPEP